MSTAMDFGVQSFCFRHFKDNAVVAAKVRELGLNKIELCAIHADFGDLAAWPQVVQTYRQAGVQIVSLGVQTFTGDEQKERPWFECAKAAGAKYISAHFRVDSFPQAVPLAAKLGQEYGVKIAIHCHGGYMFGGSPDVLGHLMALGGPQIGLCIDTAWCMQIGPHAGKPIEWAERFKERLYGLHYKDFTFEPNGMWKDVIVGTGNLDLPGFVKKLDEVNFGGYAVIEYEAEVENPSPALKRCVDAMRAAVK